jgi:multiple sugar transport system substrate-binding protein
MKPEDMKKVFEGAFTHGRESSNHLLARWDQLNQVWSNNFSTYFSNANADTKQMLQTVEKQTNEQLAQIKAEGAK